MGGDQNARKVSIGGFIAATKRSTTAGMDGTQQYLLDPNKSNKMKTIFFFSKFYSVQLFPTLQVIVTLLQNGEQTGNIVLTLEGVLV